MPKKIILSLGGTFVFLFVLLNLVQAKGGGGGGGGGEVVCTADRWDCTQWTECSAQSQQTRSCSLPACEGTPPAKPAESQSCTPPKAQTRPLIQPQSKAQPKSSTPAHICRAADESKCTGWGVCEEDGKQRRTCLTQGCAQERTCPGLKCGHLPTIEERIECRVKLTPVETRAEQKILYAPEYCRIEETPEDKAECINLYWALERCWAMPAGSERIACGREEVGMDTFDTEKKACSKKKKSERRECTEALNDKTENWILFELYELEFLAEELLKEGKIALKDVVTLDVFVEKQKAKLEESESPSNWNKIKKDTMKYWKNFKKTKVEK